jgi:hypothetical protein
MDEPESETIGIEVRPAERAVFERAAEASGITLGVWMYVNLRHAAIRTLKDLDAFRGIPPLPRR